MKDKQFYKKLLEHEHSRLKGELDELGRHDPQNPENWDAVAPKMDVMLSDENEAADLAEEMHIDSSVLNELESQYRLILHAEQKMIDGIFGACEVCGKPIEEGRLDANPAARTCKSDMGKEDVLAL